MKDVIKKMAGNPKVQDYIKRHPNSDLAKRIKAVEDKKEK